MTPDPLDELLHLRVPKALKTRLDTLARALDAKRGGVKPAAVLRQVLEAGIVAVAKSERVPVPKARAPR